MAEDMRRQGQVKDRRLFQTVFAGHRDAPRSMPGGKKCLKSLRQRWTADLWPAFLTGSCRQERCAGARSNCAEGRVCSSARPAAPEAGRRPAVQRLRLLIQGRTEITADLIHSTPASCALLHRLSACRKSNIPCRPLPRCRCGRLRRSRCLTWRSNHSDIWRS